MFIRSYETASIKFPQKWFIVNIPKNVLNVDNDLQESIDDDAEKNLIFVVKFSPVDLNEANLELEFSGVTLDDLPALILFTEPDRVLVYKGTQQN